MKDKFITVTVAITVILILAIAILVAEFDRELDSTQEALVEAEQSLAAVEQELLVTQRELSAAQEELDVFIDPIEYGVAAAQVYDIPLSEELQQYTYDMCRYYEIEQYYATVLGLMWQESNYKADAISSTNDYGLMQINVCNHSYLRENLGIVDFLDPYENIQGGTYILSTLVDKYGNIDKALMAYNLGPSSAASFWDRGIYSTPYSRGVNDKTDQILNGQYESK